MPAKPSAAAPPAPADPAYPTIEGFIEKATSEEVSTFFAGTREQLAGLKGPRAEQAKKVTAAIENAEELLGYLLQVRERLTAERQGGKRQK